ncbi:Hsp20 family protein [Candidatus Gracilibacteria bacterium]|nr:Hsp20 family protein [Candidatus Gracilibacteria bacterium]
MFKLFGVSNNNEEEFDELSEEIEETENDLGQISLDIIEKDTSIIIIAPIAGVELKHIDITVNKNILIISGNRKKPLEYYEGNILRNSECFWGEFSRNIILPENMDFDNIKAVMENNLLIVNIPRLNLDSKSIKINKIES